MANSESKSLVGPIIFLVIGLFLLGYTMLQLTGAVSDDGLTALFALFFGPITLAIGGAIAIPAAIILVKRMVKP